MKSFGRLSAGIMVIIGPFKRTILPQGDKRRSISSRLLKQYVRIVSNELVIRRSTQPRIRLEMPRCDKRRERTFPSGPRTFFSIPFFILTFQHQFIHDECIHDKEFPSSVTLGHPSRNGSEGERHCLTRNDKLPARDSPRKSGSVTWRYHFPGRPENGPLPLRAEYNPRPGTPARSRVRKASTCIRILLRAFGLQSVRHAGNVMVCSLPRRDETYGNAARQPVADWSRMGESVSGQGLADGHSPKEGFIKLCRGCNEESEFLWRLHVA